MHAPVYRSRLRGLVPMIAKHLRPGDRLLDVGCGSGLLAAALAEHRPDVTVHGVETNVRPDAAVEVTAYDGRTLPFPDGAFDAVLVADVLHHDPNPVAVLAECRRVTRRLVIVKDHKPDGPFWSLPYRRVCLMDWAANRQYGIPCRYEYPTLDGWHERFAQAGLGVSSERTRLQLYPPPYRWFFTPRLQYLAVLAADGIEPVLADGVSVGP